MAVEIDQAKDDGGLDQGRKGVKIERLGQGYTLEVDAEEFGDRFHVGCENTEGKVILRFLV